MPAPGGMAPGAGHRPGAVQARHILALLRQDAVDAAIEAGLPAFAPLPGLAAEENDALLAARDRLLSAWAARGRYRARAARLQRIEQDRARADNARTLPPAAAAALERARARALARGK